MPEPTAREVNAAFLNMIEQGHIKQAQNLTTDYIRVRMREDGFARRICPPIQITNDELDRQVDTDKPVKVVDMEPNSPGAISVPFGTLPINQYIRAPRFRVMMARIESERFTKDIDELRTYDMDIRQILSDNALKDMLAEEDGSWIAATNSLLVGQGSTVPATGTVQWKAIAGGITRDTLAEGMRIMPSTPNHLQPSTALINNITIWDIVKFGRDEVGGDMAQDMFSNGFAEREIMGVRFIITIKTNLVPNGTIFYYAEPKFLGKFFILEDTVLYVDRKMFMLEFSAYESIGASIANVAAVARADY